MKYFYKLFLAILTFFSFNSFGQAVTLSTEAVPSANVLVGDKALIYTFKIHADVGSTSWQSISLNTSGTYIASDVVSFTLYVGRTNAFGNNVLSATAVGVNATSTPVGSGELLTFNNLSTTFFGNPITTLEDKYFFVVANLSPFATIGNTIFVNGLINPALITFTPATTVVNNQSNIFGTKTVVSSARQMTLSTEPIPVGNIFPSTPASTYLLKVKSDIGNQTITAITVPFSGTVLSSQISAIFYESSSNSSIGAEIPANITVNSTGIIATVIFGSRPVLGSGETKYFFVRISVSPITPIGSTFKVNGSSGPIILNALNLPTQVNLQSDAAGLKTVAAPSVTQTTEALPAINIYKEQKVAIYKMRIDPGLQNVVLTGLSLTTTGTYLNTDIFNFELALGNNINPSTTLIGSAPNGSIGNGETVSFTFNTTFDPNSNSGFEYIYIMANLKNTATFGRTIKVNGALNPAILTYAASGTIITNSQSDLIGMRTISPSNLIYTAQSVSANNIAKGSLKNVIYKAKLSVFNQFVNLDSISFMTSGTYLSSEFTNIRLSLTNTDNLNTVPNISSTP
jgi:hypothetical protein